MRFRESSYMASAFLILIGLFFSIYGFTIRGKIYVVEPKGKFWIEGEELVPPNGKRITWGLVVPPGEIPDYWRLHVIFQSNASVWVRAFWDDPERIMYERFGKNINEVSPIKLCDESYCRRWTWYIDNSGECTALIKNFTVIYEGIVKPNEIYGLYTIFAGIISISGGIIILILQIRKRPFP